MHYLQLFSTGIKRIVVHHCIHYRQLQLITHRFMQLINSLNPLQLRSARHQTTQFGSLVNTTIPCFLVSVQFLAIHIDVTASYLQAPFGQLFRQTLYVDRIQCRSGEGVAVNLDSHGKTFLEEEILWNEQRAGDQASARLDAKSAARKDPHGCEGEWRKYYRDPTPPPVPPVDTTKEAETETAEAIDAMGSL